MRRKIYLLTMVYNGYLGYGNYITFNALKSKGYFDTYPEFRKIECKRKVDKIIIYSTSPIMKVVGKLILKKYLKQHRKKFGRKHKIRPE